MKKLIVGALLMVGMTVVAQEGKPLQAIKQKEMSSEEREQNQLKKLTSELNLDAKQQKEMAEVLNERSAKRDAMIAERKANKERGTKPTAEERKERRSDMDAFRAEQDAKIRKILTNEQAAKWEKLKAEQKAKRQDKMENRQKSE